MESVHNVKDRSMMKCKCGHGCARRLSHSAAHRGEYYLNCANCEIAGARFCSIFVWEKELEDYTDRSFRSIKESAHFHKQHHGQYKNDYFELLDEFGEAECEIRKLKKINKVLQVSLAATAPVAATLAVAAAWIAK